MVEKLISQAYLNCKSAHPNYKISGNVNSQSLQLRWVINSRERLRVRLILLSEAFKKAERDITSKVLNSAREINPKNIEPEESEGKIIVVSTFQADEKFLHRTGSLI